MFEAIGRTWGKLDIAPHAIAYALRQDIHGRATDRAQDGFLMALDVSCPCLILRGYHEVASSSEGSERRGLGSLPSILSGLSARTSSSSCSFILVLRRGR